MLTFAVLGAERVLIGGLLATEEALLALLLRGGAFVGALAALAAALYVAYFAFSGGGGSGGSGGGGQRKK